MADDQDFEIWDAEFLQEAIQLTEAAVCSSSTNRAQSPPPPPPRQQHFRPPPQQTFRPAPPPQQTLRPAPPPQPQYVPSISYSPPRELSQRVKEDNHKNCMNYSSDCSNGINHSSSRLNEDDNCSKQKQIDQLKEELGRMSKQLTNMEQECMDLRKVREKSEKHLRLVQSVNGSKDAEAFCTKLNLKCKDPVEDHSVIHLETKGVIPCKAVGVQTDEHAILTDEHTLSADLTIKKSLSVSRKLARIWEPRSDHQPKTNLVSKLFVACETDLQVLFGCLVLNIPSKKTTNNMEAAPNHSIQAYEAAKVSHLYITLTKISYDIGRLDDFLEALVDLCCLQNAMIAHRSLCVLNVVLKHILSMDKRLCSRDNVIINDPSNVTRSFGKHSEMGHHLCETINETSTHHPVRTKSRIAKIWNKDTLKDGSSPLISNSKWLFLFQMMHQIVARDSEEIIRVEAVSIMNIIVLRTDAYMERKMYGEVTVFQSISQLLGKEAGIGVQKQTVHLLYLLLNCPNLMSMFCSSCKEEGTSTEGSTMNVETALPFQCSSIILDGLADCLVCHGNGAPATLVLKLQRHAVSLLALLASSGRHGFELLLGRNFSQKTNFLYLILQVLASELDVESSKLVQPSDNFRERTLLILEALGLLNRLASSSQYSTPVLRVLTNRDMACLTVDIASRLSRKSKWLLQPDTVTRQIRESEIMDLARNFKKRVFIFLGDATS